VSAIALLVALSVAGYVYTRRRRDQLKQREDDEMYKFQETNRNSYMETSLPQYTGMIQPSLPSLPQLT
jgi:lipopolysaccharide export system protein LptC